MKRVSKAEWLSKALALLEKEGPEAVRVERLARELGISKSGFYWHFKDREELRAEMVRYWASEFTKVVTTNPLMQEGTPRERLERTMCMIIDHDLARYDLPLRLWAAADAVIARSVRAVFREREEFARGIFRELGFRGEDLEMRTRFFLCFHSWERSMFWTDSKKSRRESVRRRADLLIRK